MTDWNGPNEPGCGNPPTPPSPIQVTENAEGCDLASIGFPDTAGTATRTGVREYVLVGMTYVLEPESGIQWSDWTVTEYDDDEYFEECATDQPDPITREVAGVQTDCEMNGTTYTIDTVHDRVRLELRDPGLGTRSRDRSRHHRRSSSRSVAKFRRSARSPRSPRSRASRVR